MPAMFRTAMPARLQRSSVLAALLGAILVLASLSGPAGHASATSTTAQAPSGPAVLPAAAVPRVKARGITLSGGAKLKVNVNPNLKGKKYWRFKLQRHQGGAWRTLGTFRTQGKAETRSFTVATGRYRVKVHKGHGRKARTSKALNYDRPVAAKPKPKPKPKPQPKPAPKPTPKPTPVASLDLGSTMTPSADPTIDHFVVRCPGGRVTATIRAGGGGSVVLGARPAATSNQTVTVPLTEGQGLSWRLVRPGQATVTQHARCLPADFPTWTVERPGTPSSQWYLFSPAIFSSQTNHYAIVTDNRGTPVWWRSTGSNSPVDMTVLPDRTIAWTYAAGSFSFGATYANVTWAGKERPAIGTGLGLDQHDLVTLPNGHRLALRYVPRNCPAVASECVDMTAYGGSRQATIIDGEIVEFDQGHRAVWSWSARGRIPLAEAADHLRTDAKQVTAGVEYWDYLHLNSVEPDGDGLIISARNTDAVYRIDRATGAIDWKLGGTPTSKSLTVVGDATVPFLSSQHDARRADDGSLTLFDNGSGVAGRIPRALRIAIDPAARTATVRSIITDPNAPPIACCGSARSVPGGGMAIGWGGVLGGLITETDARGRAVLRIHTLTGFTYRVAPVAPGRVAAADLRAGMDAMHARAS